MNYFLNEDQEMIRDLVREIAEEKVVPAREELDEKEEFPWDIMEVLAKSDLFGLFIPEEFGGLGKGSRELCIAVEELSRACLGVATTYAANALGTFPLLLYGTEEQKQKYLPDIAQGKRLVAFGLTEANAGSDAAGIQTTAVADGDEFVLNGTKQWITNGGEADVYTIIAMTDKSKGARGASAFVLEKGIELSDQKYLMQGWEMIKGNVDKITNLSLDLLNYAKKTDLEFQTTDPNQPAREVLDLMRPRARELGIDLVKDFSDRQHTCQFDANLIYRCLLNLVTNAIDACAHDAAGSPKKKVVLRVRKKPDGSIEYRVQDNGCGMNAEVKKNIFQQFFSTKGSEGTGIGLMITKKIVDEHHGEITVESEEGIGSTFIIRIPGKQPDS